MDLKKRADWINKMMREAGASGIVFGNSGGKDSALVGILSKMATDNVLSVIMPCESSVNFGSDRSHALLLAKKFNIETLEIDLTPAKAALREAYAGKIADRGLNYQNINPRLRMLTLYAAAQERNYLVAGTGNKSERYMGYFTKWGDGAFDINPIGDMTVGEIYRALKGLGCPEEIIVKPPSAGLFEGQTDEREMGISYAAIDEYLLNNNASNEDAQKIEAAHKRTEHKRLPPRIYPD